ncbi:TetR/AcrR family transcriptional regulator [Paraburkholderia pallida]|uniref:TetR family transcriptional regulator n=1 Tax=Paraburkholderia pallida TaxID=2547399 RepID=A0A4V1AYY6_9BURK|nr:TetR/AcrR family transcriptional regulator [Paraburkholderia pallida]QBQ97402.1 TetR family transcriptional regulator [Paraburkholderia pallida]
MNTTEPNDRSADALRVALRARILDAARRIVTRDGLHALSMRKLAVAIGYSPAALYLYFESRDAIARALGRDGFAQLLAHLEPLGAIADPRERLHALAHDYVAFARAHRQAYRLMYAEAGEGGQSAKQAVGRAARRETAASPAAALQDDALSCEEAARVAALFTDTLDALAAAGQLRQGAEGESALLARALWAMLHGMVVFSLIGPEFAPEASLAPIVDAALAGWLGAPVAEHEGAQAQHGTAPLAPVAKQTQEGLS